MNKRDFLGQLAVGAGIVALPLAIEAEAQRAAKPLTTEGIVKTLLTQADKCRKQGLQAEAGILVRAAKEMLALSGGVGVVPCDIDSDCQSNNGGDGYGK